MGRANVEVVTRLLDAFARRDGEAMVEVLDEDFLFEPAPTPAREYRTYVGHSGMRQYLNDVGETWERLDLTIQEYRHAGDYVLVFGRIYTARQGSVADDPATFRALCASVFAGPSRGPLCGSRSESRRRSPVGA